MERKSIFITGAGSGIGKESALKFAKEGWFVGLSDINETAIRDLSNEIGQQNCSTHVLDIRNIDEVQTVSLMCFSTMLASC